MLSSVLTMTSKCLLLAFPTIPIKCACHVVSKGELRMSDAERKVIVVVAWQQLILSTQGTRCARNKVGIVRALATESKEGHASKRRKARCSKIVPADTRHPNCIQSHVQCLNLLALQNAGRKISQLLILSLCRLIKYD